MRQLHVQGRRVGSVVCVQTCSPAPGCAKESNGSAPADVSTRARVAAAVVVASLDMALPVMPAATPSPTLIVATEKRMLSLRPVFVRGCEVFMAISFKWGSGRTAR